MLGKVDERFFQKYTGKFSVNFAGLCDDVESCGTDWTLLEFVLVAWKNMTGKDRRGIEPREEAKNWSLIRVYFFDGEGVAEVRMNI